eukprot:6492213-Amphidinium_carterae.3
MSADHAADAKALEGDGGAEKSSSSSISSNSSTRSSSSSSSSKRKKKPARATATPATSYQKFWTGGTFGDVFKLTPKQGGTPGGGVFGGYEAECPFHRKNETTGCKKWSACRDASQQARKDSLVRLHLWCLAHSTCTLQREHVALPLQQDVSSVDLAAIRSALKAEMKPSSKALSDRQKDATAGLDPDAAPRRVATKRVPRKRGVLCQDLYHSVWVCTVTRRDVTSY